MKRDKKAIGSRGEELFHSIFEQSPLSIQVFGPDGLTIRVNRAWEEFWGVTLDQIPEYNILEDEQFVAKGIMGYLKRAFIGESVDTPPILYNPEESLPHRTTHDDPRRWVRAFIYPVKDEQGQVCEVVLMHEDITDRMLSEERLHYQLELTSTITNSAAEGLCMMDAEGRLTFMNPAAELILGWKQAELLGHVLHNKLHYLRPDGRPFPIEECQLSNVLKSCETIREREDVWIHQGGQFISVSYTCAPIISDGRVVSAVVSFQDITERKRAEESLRESEEQFRLLFENSRDAIVIADDAGNYLQINESACELLGYPREQLLRMNVSDLQTTNSPAAAILYQVYTRTGNETGEFSFVRPDGEQRVAQFTASSFAPGLHLSILRDITERKLAEQALRESEDRYRDLVENSHELICTHDLEGRILSVNPWALQILGYEQRSLVGMNIRDGLTPEHRDEFDDYIRRIRRDGFAKGFMQVRTARRDVRIWEYHNTLRTEGVEAPVVRGMAHDVTERRQALAREREARQEAEAANRAKDEFLATVSHELRTPLTAVVGWASMLRSGRFDTQTTAHALEVIERNAGAQAQIIEDILDVSRIITGKTRLNMQTTDPALIVVAAVETIRPAAQAKGIALACSLDPQVGTATADPDRLRQIAWNLLSNAVKFTPQGGRIEVRLERTGGYVRFIVSDNGMGISAAFLPHIFERFRQADSSTTRKHGGLGLGLAIVRHLVELHGGTVSAASEGDGATFTVSLPVNGQHHQEADVPVGGSARLFPGPADGESVGGYPALEGLRLLVVEDEEDMLAMLAVVFGRCGAEVKAVGSTAEALSLIEGWRPHVLVSDLGLPGEDGYSLIRKVREKESREGGFIPAVALSGYARTEDKAQALAAGYQLHLAKPVGLLDLTNAVAKLTGRDGGDRVGTDDS